MTRPLFDPDKMRGPDPPSPPRSPGTAATPEGPITVAQLAELVARTLQERLPGRLRVVGEISGLNERTHWYFRLKDDQAVLDCVMFTSAARRVGFTPQNGMKVVLSGRVEFYGKQGRTQFYAEQMETVGEGELERRFRELCAQLRAQGWFDPERKRPVPAFPRRVAVVTSRTGAALQDVLVTMQRRCPSVGVLIVDVRVQGEDAAGQIAEAVGHISREHEALGVDAVLVTRGGGSMEDLWAFNELVVASAIRECAVPVVAAIGHETDVTIAELVADERCATPTQAAMRLTPDRAALSEEMSQLGTRLVLAGARRLEREWSSVEALNRRLIHAAHRVESRASLRLERLASRLARLRPEAVFASRRARLADAATRLERAIRARLSRDTLDELREDLARAWAHATDRHRQRLESLARELAVAGPQNVLARGYSVTTDAAGRVVRSPGDVAPGALLRTRLAEGIVESQVTGESRGVESLAPTPLPPRPSPAAPGRTRARVRRSDPNQPGLFGPPSE